MSRPADGLRVLFVQRTDRESGTSSNSTRNVALPFSNGRLIYLFISRFSAAHVRTQPCGGIF